MKSPSFIKVTSISLSMALGILFAFFAILPSAAMAQTDSVTLTVYSGAGLMHPMDELIQAFEEAHPGIDIQVNYAGSGEHFGMIAIQKTGDVFVPGSDKFMDDALKKEYVLPGSVRTLCYHVPVILTPAGNPAGIGSLDDLAKPGMRLGIGDPQATAIGKIAHKMFKRDNLTEKITPNIVVRPITVNQLLIYTATAQVDAVLAWEDQALWAEGKGKVTIVPIPASRNIIKTIPAGVVSFTKNPEWAEKFVSWISSEKGQAVWTRWQFPVTKPE
jgi:molybdate transport system substrate-binding protein